MFALLKQNGKVIIFMVDIEYFRDTKQSDNEKLFYLLSKSDVVKEIGKTGFIAIETIEHSKEKKCYFITGYKK